MKKKVVKFCSHFHYDLIFNRKSYFKYPFGTGKVKEWKQKRAWNSKLDYKSLFSKIFEEKRRWNS